MCPGISPTAAASALPAGSTCTSSITATAASASKVNSSLSSNRNSCKIKPRFDSPAARSPYLTGGRNDRGPFAASQGSEALEGQKKRGGFLLITPRFYKKRVLFWSLVALLWKSIK